MKFIYDVIYWGMYGVFLYIEIVNILMGRRQGWFGGVGVETQL